MSDFQEMLQAQAAARMAEAENTRLQAENAKLRAEVDFANERAGKAEVERDKLKGVIAQHDLCHDLDGKVGARDFAMGCAKKQRELYGCAPHLDDADSLVRECHQFAKHLEEARAELASLRQQAEAAAPSDAEIEAWRQAASQYLAMAWKHIAGGTPNLPAGIPSEGRRMLDEAVKLMRAQRAAPAPSALREAAKGLSYAAMCAAEAIRCVGDASNAAEVTAKRWRAASRLDEKRAEVDAALAAEPQAAREERSGVVVPEDVRAKAAELLTWASRPVGFGDRARELAQWIVSLPGATQPATPAAQPDAELQRLLDEFRRINDDNGWASAQTRLLEALTRRVLGS